MSTSSKFLYVISVKFMFGLCFLFLTAGLHAQVPFQRTIGLAEYEGLISLLPVGDGYVGVGITNSAGAGNYDIILLKTHEDFSPNWCKIYGGPLSDYPHTIINCSDGGYLIVGRTESFGEGEDDVLVIKLDAAYDIEWNKTYGQDKTDIGYCAIETQNNGYLIGGATQSGKGGLVFEIDYDGNLKWSKTYGFDESSFACYNVLLADNGNYVLDGRYESSGQGTNFMLMEIDPDGNLEWAKTYNAADRDEPSDIVKVPGDGYYILGFSESFGNGSADMHLLKTDMAGDCQWSKNYGNNAEDMWSNQMILTSENELLLTCHTDLFDKLLSDIVVIKSDLNGNFQWGMSYGGTNLENQYFGNHRSLIEVNSNLFTVAGKTASFGEGKEDIYMFGFDKDGSSGCHESAYAIVESSHVLPTESVALPVEDFTPGIHDPALITGDLVMIDSLLCPDDQVPLALFSATNTDLCIGECIDFMDGSLYDPIFWEWSFEGGNPASSLDPSPGNICYADTGCFDVQLIVTNFAGSDTLLMEDYICVHAGPDFSLGNDTTLCFADSISLNVPAGYTNFIWSTGSLNQEIVVNQTGEYWLEIEDSYGCSSSDTIQVDINAEIILDLGADTILCPDDSISLFAPPGYAGYVWSTGSSATEIVVSQTGEYWLELADTYGCTASDTILIEFKAEINIDIGPDRTLCEGDSILLSGPAGFDHYYWQDGSIDSEFLVKSEGLYWLEVSNDDGCGGADTAFIAYADPPYVSLGNDTASCGTDILFEVDDGYDTYIWQDGSDSHTFIADTTGTYWVEVTSDIGCINADTVDVEITLMPVLFLGNDTSYCKEISILLDAGNDYDQYLWQDGSDYSTFIAEDYGIYWVQVYLNGCVDGDTLVIVQDCPSKIWFPSGFTPNGDAKNDQFKPVYDNVKEYNLLIYDRWGALVFESNNIDTGWDGNIKGKSAPTGVYVFRANYRDEQMATSESISGVLTLLR